MPFDGNGVYTPPAPEFPAVAGTVIESAAYNTVINDIATALDNCLTRDGQGVPTANISWSGYKLQNLGTPTLPGDAAPYSFVVTATQNRSMGNFLLTNVGSPGSAGDAANKAYVDAVIPTPLTSQSLQLATLAWLTNCPRG